MVLVGHWFESADAAKGFFASPMLKDAMARAGVDESSLRIDFFQQETAGAPGAPQAAAAAYLAAPQHDFREPSLA